MLNPEAFERLCIAVKTARLNRAGRLRELAQIPKYYRGDAMPTIKDWAVEVGVVLQMSEEGVAAMSEKDYFRRALDEMGIVYHEKFPRYAGKE